MVKLRSGFKVSVPLIFCPGGAFNGHLAICTDIEFGTITIHYSEIRSDHAILLDWQGGTENFHIKSSLQLNYSALSQAGTIPPVGCSLKLSWSINKNVSFFSDELHAVSLNALSLYTLLQVYGLSYSISDSRFPASVLGKSYSLTACAFLGGGVWYGGSGFLDRLYLPNGLSLAFVGSKLSNTSNYNNDVKSYLIPTFLMNLNRNKIDRCLDVGHFLCEIENTKQTQGLLLHNHLHHCRDIGILFLNNTQAENYLRNNIPSNSSNIIGTISNVGLKKH